MVDFVLSHPNICGGVTYHTLAAATSILRGPNRRNRPTRDMRMFKEIGAMATEGDRLRLLQHL